MLFQKPDKDLINKIALRVKMSSVLYAKIGYIAKITIDRPESLNALNSAVFYDYTKK